jgi:hypothetical protein
LHPERLDDSGMDARLADLKTIGLSSRLISNQFEQPLLDHMGLADPKPIFPGCSVRSSDFPRLFA